MDIGDHVRQGQTLAVLEVPELQAEVAGAQAGISQTQQNIIRLQSEVGREQAGYAAVHANYVRLKQASDQQPGLVAAQEVDDALAKDRSAASQVDAAKSAVAAAQGQLGVSRAFNLEQKNSALIIPASAVIQGDQPSVMLVDTNNEVQKRQVDLGIAGANQQEVASGLQPGDRVIIGGLSTLQPGEKVTPQEASSKLTEFQSANQKGGK